MFTGWILRAPASVRSKVGTSPLNLAFWHLDRGMQNESPRTTVLNFVDLSFFFIPIRYFAARALAVGIDIRVEALGPALAILLASAVFRAAIFGVSLETLISFAGAAKAAA